MDNVTERTSNAQAFAQLFAALLLFIIIGAGLIRADMSFLLLLMAAWHGFSGWTKINH